MPSDALCAALRDLFAASVARTLHRTSLTPEQKLRALAWSLNR